MYLYHLTWEPNVESIMRLGLIPNYRPNPWAILAARLRVEGKTFLCNQSRRGYWLMTYQDGWAGYPFGNANLKWLRVSVLGLEIRMDIATNPNDDYTGDFYTSLVVPPDRIQVIKKTY